jgi:hypothetical protein
MKLVKIGNFGMGGTSDATQGRAFTCTALITLHCTSCPLYGRRHQQMSEEGLTPYGGGSIGGPLRRRTERLRMTVGEAVATCYRKELER